MAMTQQQQNALGELMTVAEDMFTQVKKWERLVERFDDNGFLASGTSTKITTPNCQEIAAYSHLTAPEIEGALQALRDMVDMLKKDSTDPAVIARRKALSVIRG